MYGENTLSFIRNTVRNFSTYQLISDKEKVVSFELDEHIPSVCNRHELFTEFELFNQNLIKDIPASHDNIITKIKTKLRHTCDKYSRIRVPYKYHIIMKNLRNNTELIILKQDKGRGVILLDR